ncbi:MAG: peptide deformylase [Methylophagaceae bacterium]|jgi:peptide deformylase|tara:strand:- start:3507 stop:4004 length:498 start_codon:yes stop_codon:yes gene_type:complete
MKLIKSPNTWLQTEVDPFDFDKFDAKDVSEKMIALMVLEGGIGLSANQVGLNGQIFVMKPHLLEDNTPLTVINPIIDKVSVNTELMPEGCLSHPDLYLKVARPKGLVVKFLDIDAKECIMELYDIDARCFLHEYDHLQGIEFTNRVSRLKLDMAKKKQTKIRKTQ